MDLMRIPFEKLVWINPALRMKGSTLLGITPWESLCSIRWWNVATANTSQSYWTRETVPFFQAAFRRRNCWYCQFEQIIIQKTASCDERCEPSQLFPTQPQQFPTSFGWRFSNYPRPGMDFRHPARSLLIKPLISRVATVSKVRHSGSGPVEGRSSLVLSSSSPISLCCIPVCSDTRDSCIVLCTVGFVRDWWHSHTKFSLIW